jgi:glucosamine--fructose-6-phosphate aminotransferase (isomerizing)
MSPGRTSAAAADPPTRMLREAAEAPEVVGRLIDANADACRALGERLQHQPPGFVGTSARGSADSAATNAK